MQEGLEVSSSRRGNEKREDLSQQQEPPDLCLSSRCKLNDYMRIYVAVGESVSKRPFNGQTKHILICIFRPFSNASEFCALAPQPIHCGLTVGFFIHSLRIHNARHEI